MSISFEHMECHKSEVGSLSAVRDAILRAAKAAEEAGRHDQLVFRLSDGKYPIRETFSLSVKENPELSHVDITLKGCGASEITSLVSLPGRAFVFPEGKNYSTYEFPRDGGEYPLFRELFLNYKRIPMSKSPMWINPDPLTDDERNGNLREGFFVPYEIAEKLASDDIASTELVIYIEWVFASLHVTGVDLTKTKTVGDATYALVTVREDELYEFSTKFARHLNIGNREAFFRNAPAFLETNTFAYDFTRGKLYLNAASPEYTWCHAIEYPALETLFSLDGIENFTVEGLRFTGTTCRYGCTRAYWCSQANTIRTEPYGRVLAAGLLAKDARNLTVKGCTFRALGTNGVQLIDKSVRTRICNSVFEDVGMSGIAIGNPRHEWDEQNRNYNVRIENNHLKNIAFDYPAAPAIYVALVDGIKILHNTVDTCAYSAISVGWNWIPAKWEPGEAVNIRNAEIAYNYFHNFMELLRDGGPIYVVGGNANKDTVSERFNRMHHNYAALDFFSPHGKYGYYLDGSSSNWEVSDSVVINVGGCPIFSQKYEGALSYHNRFQRIYSNTPHGPWVQAPYRDIATVDYYLVEEGAEELLRRYPEAQAIRDAAGAKLNL